MKRDEKEKFNHVVSMVVLICTAVVIVFNMATVINMQAYQGIREKLNLFSERVECLETEPLQRESVQEISGKEEIDIEEERRERDDEPEKKNEEVPLSEALEEQADALSASKVEEIMKEAQNMGGHWAFSIMSLRDGTVFQQNEKASMQSASVIKVFIMAAVYGRVCYPAEQDSAIYAPEQYEGELKDLLTSMITVSNNEAANRLVELLGSGDFEVGKEIVNEFCRSSGYPGTHLGRRFLEENSQDDNYTTAEDCRKILEDLYNGNCVCAEASGKMLALIQNQTLISKIPAGLPEGILSANKTGEMPEGYGLGCIENDIAIVYGEQRDYIICILANDLAGKNEEAREVIRNVSRQVYEELQ